MWERNGFLLNYVYNAIDMVSWISLVYWDLNVVLLFEDCIVFSGLRSSSYFGLKLYIFL